LRVDCSLFVQLPVVVPATLRIKKNRVVGPITGGDKTYNASGLRKSKPHVIAGLLIWKGVFSLFMSSNEKIC
jgi:hypothetical protein